MRTYKKSTPKERVRAKLWRSALVLALCLPLLTMAALAAEPAAGEGSPPDALAYAGLWHASPALGSGFSTRLALNADSTFLWAASEMDGLERARFRSGTWTAEHGTLRLVVEEEVRWEGGREVPASGSMATETEIVGAEVVIHQLNAPAAEEYELGQVEKDAEVIEKRTVAIGGIRYWELAHPMDLETLRDDFTAIKEQAARTVHGAAEADRPNGGTDQGLSSRLSASTWLEDEGVNVLRAGSICLFRNDEKESVPYRWRYHISDENVIGFFHSEYEISAESRPIPGGDVGWRRFYFEALNPGECEIAFRYGRYGDEWDDEWDEEYRYAVVVTPE